MATLNSMLHILRQLLKIQTEQLTILLKLVPVVETTKEEEVWLHTDEVMKVFKKSERTIYNWRKAGDLRFKLRGRTCQYLKSDVYDRVKKGD